MIIQFVDSIPGCGLIGLSFTKFDYQIPVMSWSAMKNLDY